MGKKSFKGECLGGISAWQRKECLERDAFFDESAVDCVECFLRSVVLLGKMTKENVGEVGIVV